MNIIIIDTGASVIKVFSREGQKGPGEFEEPNGIIDINGKGRIVVVVDNKLSHKLQFF